MLSIKKNLGLLAMTVALAACASNPNDLPDFPEHEYAATQQVGEGVINGDLYLTLSLIHIFTTCRTWTCKPCRA